jgi:AraC family transcriptional regulator of adaptative response / DNA-3-methyladenine glycosylase II
VSAASTFAARLTKRFGKSIQTPFPGLTHLAPTAKTLATAEQEEFLLLGITRARAKSIQSMAHAVLIGAVSLDLAVSIETALNQLKTLPGIGDWTAHYFAMRIFGWPDAFPHSDLGILKALNTTKPREALSRAESWRPWRAYAAMHLWKSLEKPVAPKLAKAEPVAPTSPTKPWRSRKLPKVTPNYARALPLPDRGGRQIAARRQLTLAT